MGVVWKRLARRVTRSSAACPAVELRVQLARLWPAGSAGPVDVEALRSLSREYARSGRTLEDLFDDIDQLCDVVGIGTPSRVMEACGVAWSDAFLDTVDPSTPPAELAEESLHEVEQQLTAHGSDAWRDLPGGRLVVISLASTAAEDTAEADEELAVLAAEVRRQFPHAPVAVQGRLRRVLAAVVESPDLDAGLARVEAFCSERTRSAASLETRPVPAQLDGARELLRAAI